jgi:HK97 family phage major capsid protein
MKTANPTRKSVRQNFNQAAGAIAATAVIAGGALNVAASSATADPKIAREEFTTLHAATSKLVNDAAAAKRDLTADEQVTFDKNFTRMEAIKRQEENNTRLATLAFNNERGEGGSITLSVEPGQGTPQIEVFDANELKKPELQLIRKGFNAWIKNGAMPEKFSNRINELVRTGQLPQNFATITSATASGAFLPKEVIEPLIPVAPNTFRQGLMAWGVQPMKTPTAEDISIPVASPVGAGAVVSETANSETENEATLTNSILLHCQTYQSGTTWFSNQVLMSVNFDLFSEMLPALTYAKELGFEAAAMSGISGDSGITQSVASATVSGLTYNNLVSLNRILPKRYQYLKVIVLNKAAYIAAEQLVTSTGYPILVPDAQNQELKRFNGTPVVFTDYLSGFGANNVIGFVQSLIGFRLRDVNADTIARTVMYPPRPGQQGFNLLGYHAIGYDDNAMAKFVCPAS